MGLDNDGRPLRPTAYGKTAAEAQASLKRKVAEIKRGEYKRPDPLTLRKFLEDLLADRRASNDLRESTFTLYQGIVRKHIVPRIGDKRLDKVTARDIDTVYTGLRADGASERMVKFVHVILGTAFRNAFQTERIVKNPMLRVSAVPKYKAPEQSTLTPEQGEHLLSVSRNDVLHALYVLALDTGARQGELFALRRADVDLKNRTIAIRRSVRYANDGRLMVTETKTGRDRMIPISLRSANALRSHFKAHMASEYVFTEPQTGQPLRKENFIRRSFRPLLKRAGLPTIRFHDLRHSTATRLLVQGVHPKIVQDRLGHSSITVTLDTYSHAIPSLGREAADLFDRAASAD
jgi:integrase